MSVAPPRAVVFDLDGTLLDSLPLVLQAITHAIEPFGRRPTMDLFANLGGPPERFLGALLHDLKHLPAALERLGTFHSQNAHLIRPYDGGPALLAELRALGVQVGLWTGRDRESATWLLKHHRIEEYFTAAVCGDDLPSHKPDPEGLLEVLQRLGVSPTETLFVGDSDVDVLGGGAAGVNTLLIRHSREIELHITAKTWKTVASPREAFEVVLRSVQKISRNHVEA